MIACPEHFSLYILYLRIPFSIIRTNYTARSYREILIRPLLRIRSLRLLRLRDWLARFYLASDEDVAETVFEQVTFRLE